RPGDADAGLNGELRRAHWCEAQPDRDGWAEFHVHQAAERASTVDWSALYPSARSVRSWIGTTVLAAGLIGTGVRFPARRATAEAASLDVGAVASALPAEMQEKLARLMAQLDD